MADNEDTPSVPRKKKEVELSRGVVILPPERMGREERREAYPPSEPLSLPSRRPEQSSAPPSAPTASNILAIAAVFLALVALLLSYISIMNYSNMKTEIKGIAADLRGYKAANVTITSNLGATHSVNASMPIKDVIPPFVLPVQPQDIQGTGTINVVLPGYTYPVAIPWNGTITIFGTLNINTTQLPADRQIALAYELPGQGDITIRLHGADIWTDQLENITTRLDRLSK